MGGGCAGRIAGLRREGGTAAPPVDAATPAGRGRPKERGGGAGQPGRRSASRGAGRVRGANGRRCHGKLARELLPCDHLLGAKGRGPKSARPLGRANRKHVRVLVGQVRTVLNPDRFGPGSREPGPNPTDPVHGVANVERVHGGFGRFGPGRPLELGESMDRFRSPPPSLPLPQKEFWTGSQREEKIKNTNK